MPASSRPGGRGTPGRPNAHQYRLSGEATDLATEIETILGTADIGLAESLYTGWRFYNQTLSDNSNTYTFDLTRSTVATQIGSDGYIDEVASGAARYEHPAAGGACLGLLHEDAQTNLAVYSEQMLTTWTMAAGSRTDDSSVTSIASGNSTKIECTATDQAFSIRLTGLTIAASTPYCLSVYVKYGQLQSGVKSALRIGGKFLYFSWNHTTGEPSFDSTTGSTWGAYGFEEQADGWWRVWGTLDNDLTAESQIRVYGAGVTGSISGDYIHICCLNFEQVPYGDSPPTSWIPTDSTSETRALDQYYILPPASVPLLGSAFTMYVHVYNEDSPSEASAIYVASIGDSDLDPTAAIYANGINSGRVRFLVNTYSGGLLQLNYDVGDGSDYVDQWHKIAGAWTSANGFGSVDGNSMAFVSGSWDAAWEDTDVDRMHIGAYASGGGDRPYRQILRELRIYSDKEHTQAELNALTTL